MLTESVPPTEPITAGAFDTNRTILCPLPDHGVLRVSGADAQHFLQGQITCDLRELQPAHALHAAACSVQGRVQVLFLVLRDGENLLLVALRTQLPALLRRLQPYVLRAKVQFADLSDTYSVLGLAGTNAAALPLEADSLRVGYGVSAAQAQARYLLLVPTVGLNQVLARARNAGIQIGGQEVWTRLDIRDGIPEVPPELSEEFLPQMLNLDLLGGLSFQKGCYTGQEPIARTRHLGHLKRRMYAGRGAAGLAVGQPLLLAGMEQPAGRLVRVFSGPDGDTEFLAVVMLEALDAGKAFVDLAGNPVTFFDPPLHPDFRGG